jgi:leader peptidase (prepilin peptidase)/N-methyltransferase
VRYPLVELGTALLFAAVAWQFGAKPVSLLYCGLVAALVAGLTMIDWDTTVLPDAITLPLLWAGLVLAALGWLPGVSLSASIWGAVAGYGSLWSVYWLFKLATGKEGMGFGDFKLLAGPGSLAVVAGHPAHHPDGVGSGRGGRHPDEGARQPA